MIEELTTAAFMPKVLAADGKALVEFYATWCPHCSKMEPVLEKLAEEPGDGVAIYRLDVDKFPDLANTYAPDGFPTFVVFENGEPVKTVIGEQTLEYLEGMLDF